MDGGREGASGWGGGGLETTEATESEALQMADSLVAYLRVLRNRRPSREVALALTKADETVMWLARLVPTVAAEGPAETGPGD